jgi:hypothetical protein
VLLCSCIGYLNISNSWANTQQNDWVYKKQELVFSLKVKEREIISGNSALQYSKKINLVLIWNEGLGSIVSIATAYRLDGPWIESRWGVRFSTPVQTSRGPRSLLYNEYQVFPGSKVWPGPDADPSPPSSAEVKNRVELYFYSP